jgi:hypothetical protein
MGPLVYLTLCSMRNRLRVRIKRLREPRYLIGLVVGIAYFYFLFWRPRSPRGPVGAGGGALAFMSGAHASVELFGAVALFSIAAIAWIWPSKSRPALAFSRADVQFLFPAPFTRKQLIRYRVLRSQLGALIGSAIMTLFLRPSGAASGWMFFLGVSIVMAVINLHLTGVSLSRESLGTHGLSGLARQWLPAAVVGVSLIVLVGTVGLDWPVLALMTSGVEVLDELRRLFSTGAASVVLWPFRAISKLPFSESPQAFAAALPAAVGILALNYVWVVRSDAKFEEASAELAEKVAKVRKGLQPTAPKAASKATPFTLALEGRPETAILWKNLIVVGRYFSLKTLLRLTPIFVVFGFMVARGGSRGGVTGMVAVLSTVVFFITVLMGPQLARNDLRHDLANLAVLRTWPVRGSALVRGEMLAPATILTVICWFCAIAALFTAPRLKLPPSWALSAMLLAPGIILVQLLVQNAIAVMWPSWVSIGARQARGIDVMGQRMIMMVGLLVVLAVAIIPAAIVGGLVMMVLYWATDSVHVLLPAIFAAATLFVETMLGSLMVGKMLDRTDVGQIDATEN